MNSRRAAEARREVAANNPLEEIPLAPAPERPQYLPLRPRTNAEPTPARSNPTSTSRNGSGNTESGNSTVALHGESSAGGTFRGDPSGELARGVSIVTGTSVSGVITLAGTPPPQKSMQVTDQMCGGGGKREVTTRHYVVSPEGRLANVFVYITKGLEGRRFPAQNTEPLLDNIDCQFEPYVMGVQTGQKFTLRNSDPGVHNVHAVPKSASGNQEFSIVQFAKGSVAQRSFDSQEVFIRFQCDVHPWMLAYVGVVGHPYFSVTDTNGIYRLPPSLPPGRYQLTASHLKAGNAAQNIEVASGENQVVNFTLQTPH